MKYHILLLLLLAPLAQAVVIDSSVNVSVGGNRTELRIVIEGNTFTLSNFTDSNQTFAFRIFRNDTGLPLTAYNTVNTYKGNDTYQMSCNSTVLNYVQTNLTCALSCPEMNLSCPSVVINQQEGNNDQAYVISAAILAVGIGAAFIMKKRKEEEPVEEEQAKPTRPARSKELPPPPKEETPREILPPEEPVEDPFRLQKRILKADFESRKARKLQPDFDSLKSSGYDETAITQVYEEVYGNAGEKQN